MKRISSKDEKEFNVEMKRFYTVIIEKIVRLYFSTLVSLVRLHLGGDYVSGATKFIKID